MNIVKIVLIIACLTSVNSCDPEGWSPSGEIVIDFDMRVYPGARGLPAKISKNDKFNFYPCVVSYNEPLTKVHLLISLPMEVKLQEGKLSWKGDMGPDQKQCLDLWLYSRTDLEQWSNPIKVRAEFLFKGEKITGEQNWSADEKTRYETVWRKNGREIRNY